MSKKFHEGDFFSEYKYIRNQFRKYNSYSLLDICFKFLYKKFDDEFEELEKKQPWQVLLLIKWILKDDNFDLPNRNKATDSDLIGLINLVRKLGDKVRMPNDYDHWELLFRNIAYQQFFYQRRFNLNAYSRQSLLFSNLEDNHYIKSTFRNEIGVEINEFLELSAFLLANQVKRIKSINKEYFSPLFSHYSPKLIDNYLNSLSFTFTEARQYLIEFEGNKISSYSYYEQTPFIKRPLLKFNNRYYPYYRNILYRGVEYFIYDCVREKDPEKFMQRFGSIFEDYVRDNLVLCQL